MIKSSGWIGEGNFPHNKEKTAGTFRFPRIFDAVMREIPRQDTAEPSGVIYSVLT